MPKRAGSIFAWNEERMGLMREPWIVAHVQAIGVTAACSTLYDEAIRLRHTDQHAAMDCIALMKRINVLIRRQAQNQQF